MLYKTGTRVTVQKMGGASGTKPVSRQFGGVIEAVVVVAGDPVQYRIKWDQGLDALLAPTIFPSNLVLETEITSH
jgi:hypothetical protein